jgi:hypothetical protein
LIGAVSTRNALLVLLGATLIGIVATLVAGSEPGFLLSFFIIVGAVVATLGVRPGAVYLFFPLPAFAFFVGAVITGKIHDSSLTSSTTGLGVGFLQWIAFIFFPMCLATILVLLIGGARWALSRQFVGGQFAMSADRPATPRAPRPRSGQGPRPDIDPWLDSEGTRPRPTRDPRADRDPWNDPRPSADPRPAVDRRPPSRNGPPAPPAGPQPNFRPRPANPGQPGDRTQRPPAPPRPGRPPGAPGAPRDPWDQR